MARISDEDIDRIRDASDIVSVVGEKVVLNPKGRLLWGRCPFHQEKTPSFKVDPSTGLFHCFGCGAGGDVFKFLMQSEQLEFPEAVKVLADRANIDIKWEEADSGASARAQRLRDVCAATAEYYNSILRASTSDGAARARSYLGSRGFGSEVAKQWSLGYAPGHGQLVARLRGLGFDDSDLVSANVAMPGGPSGLRDRFFDRVMFPIADLHGRVIAFGGRVLDPKGNPKYLNSNDTPIFHKSENMYGIDHAREAIVKSREALVVEGYTDVIALHSAGFTNVIATLGTALTTQHVRLLRRFADRIVYVFDGDEAGLRAADRAAEFIGEAIAPEGGSQAPIVSDVVLLPEGTDPADVVSADGGAELFRSLLSDAQPLLAFAIQRRLDRWDLGRPEEAQRALTDAASVLAPIKGSVIAGGYAQLIVDRLKAAGIPVDLSQVTKAIDESKVVRRTPARQHNLGERVAGGDDAEGSVGPGSQSAPTPVDGDAEGGFSPQEQLEYRLQERLEREALSFIAAHHAVSMAAFADVEASDFLVGHHAALYDAARQMSGNPDRPQVLAQYESEWPEGITELARLDATTAGAETIAAVAADLASRLREASLERALSQLRTELHTSEGTDELVSQIVTLQRDLEAIRRLRHTL